MFSAGAGVFFPEPEFFLPEPEPEVKNPEFAQHYVWSDNFATYRYLQGLQRLQRQNGDWNNWFTTNFACLRKYILAKFLPKYYRKTFES